MSKKKILTGLSNIHFAPFIDGEFQTPVPIEFAKKIENKLSYASDVEWADDRIIDSGFGYEGGEGVLSVLALVSKEQALLFGNTLVKGGLKVNSGDIAPEGAFLFERKKKRSVHKRLYVIYSCVCSPTGISAETIEEGKGASSVEDINYSIGEGPNGDIFYYVDTDDETIEADTKAKWFEKVQIPVSLEPPTPERHDSSKQKENNEDVKENKQ